ncbi:hypothetical protein CsSME_00002468 [Camellia sinensis var. sinensis]
MKTVQESLSTTSLNQSMIGRTFEKYPVLALFVLYCSRKNQESVAGSPPFVDGRPSFVVSRPPLLACRPPLQNPAMYFSCKTELIWRHLVVEQWPFSGGNLCMHEHSSFPEAE